MSRKSRARDRNAACHRRFGLTDVPAAPPPPPSGSLTFGGSGSGMMVSTRVSSEYVFLVDCKQSSVRTESAKTGRLSRRAYAVIAGLFDGGSTPVKGANARSSSTGTSLTVHQVCIQDATAAQVQHDPRHGIYGEHTTSGAGAQRDVSCDRSRRRAQPRPGTAVAAQWMAHSKYPISAGPDMWRMDSGVNGLIIQEAALIDGRDPGTPASCAHAISPSQPLTACRRPSP